MKKKAYLLACILLLGFSDVTYAQAVFTGGHIQALAVCKNSGANSIDTMLRVSDPSTTTTVSWSTLTATAHGTLVAAYTTTSTGGTLTPVGLTYMPNPGYSGSDHFTVQFVDGSSVDTTHVNVTVDTVLSVGTVTGPPTLCVGAHILYSDATTGGTWSVSNAAASIDGTGTATGLAPGTDTISYSLTNGCGTASATKVITVNTIPNAGHLSSPDSICVGAHVALHPGGDPGGLWHSATTVAAAVNDTGRVTGLAPGTSRITYIVTNGCGTDTVSAEVKVQTHALPIIGGNTVCPLQTLLLIDPSAGGNWSSSNFLVAPVVGVATPVVGGLVVGFTSGVATISYTLHNACGTSNATLDITVLTAAECPTAVNNVTNSKDALNVYPNPNNGSFNLNLSSGTNEQATVIITNVVGEKIMEFIAVTNQDTEVNLDKPAGLYFVSVSTSGGKSYMAKLVINH